MIPNYACSHRHIFREGVPFTEQLRTKCAHSPLKSLFFITGMTESEYERDQEMVSKRRS